MKKNKKIAIRRIRRKCLVCGKQINIKIYHDKHYHNSHHFGIMDLPIKGTGEYKAIGKSKTPGLKANIVKWTGKVKKVEYWECESCYKEAMHEHWLEQITEKLYGKKCKDYEKGCACCQAWSIYDVIIDHNRGRL